MIRDIEEMLILYKDQMVNMAKRLLKPKVYEDTRHILENIRVIPEPGGSLCVSDYARVKRTNNPTANSSSNILYIDETSCSPLESIGYVSGRISQKRSALDTDLGEGRDSSISRFLVGLGTSYMSTNIDRATTHKIIQDIIKVITSAGEVTLHILNTPESALEGSGESGQSSSAANTVITSGSGSATNDLSIIGDNIPESYEMAITGPDSQSWIEACTKEVNGLEKLKTYIIGDLPLNKKAIKLRWLFVKKSLIKFKARIVAKGFMQHFGIDYTETFSPVARYTTIRIFFALCALLSLHVNQMDVDYAFPNADIEPDVEIWCEPIAGMNVPKGKYILLKKALYGLKQAARQWNTDINTYLLSLGFTQLKTDSCMYVRGSYGLGTLVILVLYVDDMGIAAMNMKLLNKVKND